VDGRQVDFTYVIWNVIDGVLERVRARILVVGTIDYMPDGKLVKWGFPQDEGGTLVETQRKLFIQLTVLKNTQNR